MRMDVPGKLLGLDVGLARIGVATCDPLRLSVRPLTVIHRTSRRADFDQLARIVQREAPVAIVCGVPLNPDGTDGPQAQTVRKWAMRLAQALRAILGQSLPIEFWDEQLTTFAAQEYLTSERSNLPIDAVAAAVILESYLEAQRRGEGRDYGRIELPERVSTDE
jgi:putative Holliday junction resolvase